MGAHHPALEDDRLPGLHRGGPSRRHRAAEEGVFVDEKERVREGTASNVFLLSGRRAATAPVSAALLPGVVRSWVIENAPRVGMTVTERSFSAERLRDGGFFTSSLTESRRSSRSERKTLRPAVSRIPPAAGALCRGSQGDSMKRALRAVLPSSVSAARRAHRRGAHRHAPRHRESPSSSSRGGPAILVEGGGRAVLFDAGRGAEEKLFARDLAMKIDALFLTPSIRTTPWEFPTSG